jgi:hypothetical protein
MPLNTDKANSGASQPVTLSSVRRKRVPFTAKVEGETEGEFILLPGTFNPRSYTPVRLQELDRLTDEDHDGMAQILAGGSTPLLTSWELTYGAEDAEAGICTQEQIGSPVPITVESLSLIPVEVLGAVVSGIVETARPNSPNPSESRSESSSSLKEEEGTVLTNSALLEPQNILE